MDPTDLLIGEGDSAVSRAVRSVLGIEREAKVCPDCGEACQATTTYNPRTAAFDGGACPAWACPSCGRTWHREDDEDAHTLDLYGRG